MALAFVLVPIAVYFLAKHALPRLEMTEAVYGDYYWPRRFWLFAHTVAGLLATVLGPLQFIRALRESRPALHRFSGRVYLTAVLVAASCALVLAETSQISTSYKWGLILGANLWLLPSRPPAGRRSRPAHGHARHSHTTSGEVTLIQSTFAWLRSEESRDDPLQSRPLDSTTRLVRGRD